MGIGDLSARIRRVEMLAMAGAMAAAGREADAVMEAVTELHEQGLATPTEVDLVRRRLRILSNPALTAPAIERAFRSVRRLGPLAPVG